MSTSIPLLGHGIYWQDLQVGQRYRTFRRVITETDIINFMGVTGMLEAIFMDPFYENAAIKGRMAPAALTHSIIEGLLQQTLIQGVGLALLDLQMEIKAPVMAQDAIWAEVEITEVRPTSKHGRAVVGSTITVFNQHETPVMKYVVKRIQLGAQP
ncbi:MAG: MaoC family dehydratase [Candidimonas sp.]|nr:MaoC family dehydratase [Candidimonas sp.]